MRNPSTPLHTLRRSGLLLALFLFLFLFLFLALLLLPACKHSPDLPETCSDGIKNQNEVDIDCGGSACQPCRIQYPQWGTYGQNILFPTDTIYTSSTSNSFKAYVPVGSTLKIEMNLISGDPWAYTVGSNIGWAIPMYADSSQTFEVVNPGNVELEVLRYYIPTSGPQCILIKFYENSTIETRRKILIWN